MSQRKYRYLTNTDRIRLETYYNLGYKQNRIAAILGVHPSTISRELKRGRYERLASDYTTHISYSSDKAQALHDYNMTAKGKSLKIANDYELVSCIENLIIDNKYSPAAALYSLSCSGKQFKTMISVTTLYRYIDAGLFLNLSNKNLPHKSQKRKYKRVRLRKSAPSGTSIEMRPSYVDIREEFGHWEMDTVKGKRGKTKSCLLVLTERKTREEIVMKLPDQRAQSVVNALDNLENKYKDDFPTLFKTITVDNGSEFTDCSGMEKSILRRGSRTKLYYCHPYSSFERGTNENQNRLVRRHIPKGVDFDDKTDKDIQYIQDWINHYPRRLLGYRAPAELFALELQKLHIVL